MGIVIRQSIKGSIAQYLGVIVGYVNLLYVIPYCLSPEENGLFRLILETAGFFSLFAQFGVANAAPKFWPHFRNLGRSKSMGNYSLLMPFASITLFLVFYTLIFRDAFNEQLAKQSPDYIQYEWALIPIGIMILYSGILENLISNYLRVTFPKLMRELVLRITISLAVILYFFWLKDLYALFGFLSIAYAIPTLFLLGYYWVLRKQNPDEAQPQSIPGSLWRGVFRYLSILFLTGVGTNLVNKLDIFMVSSQIGLTDNAIYTTAFMITIVMEVPIRSFQQIMAPVVSSAIYVGNQRKVSWAYKKSSIGQTLVALMILTLIMLNIGWLYKTMPNSEVYSMGIPVILFLGIAKLIDAFTGINQLILLNSKYYYMTIFFTFGLAVVAIILNNLFIPRFQVIGVAAATAISILLYNLILLWYIWRKHHIHPFSKASVHLIVLFIFSGLMVFIGQSVVAESIITSFLVSGLYIILTLYYCLKFTVLKEIRMLSRKYLKFIPMP